MQTIGQLVKREPPTVFESKHGTNPNCVCPDLLIGIELELEELNPSKKLHFPGFSFTADGSLRNSDTGIAMEAVSQPLRIAQADGLLYAFWQAFGVTQKNFSERCSIHVHVNTLDMTVDQLASLCLVYQTVERLLFAFVGEGRGSSIFCVPWYQSGLTYNYVNYLVQDPTRRSRMWQKYTALNLLPITEQGTVEFRHLNGTADLKKISNWLQLIAHLVMYVRRNSFDSIKEQILQMNTVSNYRQWLEAVFQDRAGIFEAVGDYEKALNRGVIDSKFMFLEKVPEKSEKKPISQMTNAEIMEQVRLNTAQFQQRARFADAPEQLWNVAADVPLTVRFARPVPPRQVPINMEDMRIQDILAEDNDERQF